MKSPDQIVPLQQRRSTPRRMCRDRKSTRLNSSHSQISYAVFCLKKKNIYNTSYDLDRGLCVTYCSATWTTVSHTFLVVHLQNDLRLCLSTSAISTYVLAIDSSPL